MITFDNERQAEAAVRLWREAFGDEEAYIRFFLSRHDDAAALTESVDSSLVSALYLIDGELIVHSVPHKAFYLFAAATFQQHRGRGHMARLLQKAETYAQQQGAQFIALVPASPSLFDYYSRFGYQTAFYARPVGADSLSALDLTGDRFQWTNAHLTYIRNEAKAFDYELLEKDGWLFPVENGSILVPDPDKQHPYGMLLPLTETAKRIMPQNAYIGLAME